MGRTTQPASRIREPILLVALGRYPVPDTVLRPGAYAMQKLITTLPQITTSPITGSTKIYDAVPGYTDVRVPDSNRLGAVGDG